MPAGPGMPIWPRHMGKLTAAAPPRARTASTAIRGADDLFGAPWGGTSTGAVGSEAGSDVMG